MCVCVCVCVSECARARARACGFIFWKEVYFNSDLFQKQLSFQNVHRPACHNSYILFVFSAGFTLEDGNRLSAAVGKYQLALRNIAKDPRPHYRISSTLLNIMLTFTLNIA